jgi:hypothetical protein
MRLSRKLFAAAAGGLLSGLAFACTLIAGVVDISTSSEAGSDARGNDSEGHDTATGEAGKADAGCEPYRIGAHGAWETIDLPSNFYPQSMSGYLPPNERVGIYLFDKTAGYSFDPADAHYTRLMMPLKLEVSAYGSATWYGDAGSLWTTSLEGEPFLEYNPRNGIWSADDGGISLAVYGQVAIDEFGHLWAFSNGSLLVEYDLQTRAAKTHPLKEAVDAACDDASPEAGCTARSAFRIVYDGCDRKLYLTGEDVMGSLRTYDPYTGTEGAIVAGLPAGYVFDLAFCGDQSGHLFAFLVGNESMYEYTIATGQVQVFPLEGGVGATACGIGADHKLYVIRYIEGGVRMYRIGLE